MSKSIISSNQRSFHKFFLSFDVEEFTFPEERGQLSQEEREMAFSYGREGMKIIMSILKRQKIIATFFCTYEFFCKYPEVMKEVKKMGGEIGLHGYKHGDDYCSMNEKEIIESLCFAKKEMEKRIGVKIYGFRGPGFRAPSLKILEKVGFEYDSSLHPTYVPGKYNHLFQSRNICQKDNIWEIPISVVPGLRMPFSWIWFRNFPLEYAKMCTLLNIYSSSYTLLYFHPWEFVDLQEKKYPYHDVLWKLVVRNTGVPLERKLEQYIGWAKKRGVFSTMHDLLQEFKLHPVFDRK